MRGVALGLGLALLLQPLELLAAVEIPAAVEIARGGGGRGGGGRGGGGRGASRGGSGARTGFASFSGGSNRSSLRLDSRAADRSGRVDTRQGNRTDRTDLRQSNRSDRVNDRNRTRRQAINTWDRNRPNWVNTNWSVNRPWRYGWYGGSTWNNWGWWPGRAAAWGLGSLATFAVIDSLVDSAVSNQTTYIVVPDSDYSLYYSSVQVSGDLVTFQADDGSNTLTFRADCRSGTLNGYPPQNADEAQLLNAACQVAFGQ
ncbi:hypothetical protein [Synechococcus sp. HK05]|uniref:hypothetical protein n=1 Tax=Synechococcus sp. HK05 TaxID=2725975 RepID=UPI0020CB3739|nr:hypothetical protein [Synechococcus sp. HK05]